jgi:hypothetical protein
MGSTRPRRRRSPQAAAGYRIGAEAQLVLPTLRVAVNQTGGTHLGDLIKAPLQIALAERTGDGFGVGHFADSSGMGYLASIVLNLNLGSGQAT